VFAAYAEQILTNPPLAAQLGAQAAARAREFTWSTAAGRLRRMYADIAARSLITCTD
jgi:glycosyltransferase involved in cell wall biosynthesis